ncbi:MAG: citrate/2-methylcitrate synthase [Ruminococcaceae bacterium]|nr:citrate/2-methylcitrate synthase [Oscillospiraceae bacterium]
MSSNKLSEKTLEKIENYSEKCLQNCVIEQGLYIEHKVNRGLRDLNGKGVLTGLTEISDIISKKNVNGQEVPCEGELYYRGYKIDDIVNGILKDNRFGFEEIIYLLIFGELPSKAELEEFKSVLFSMRPLPDNFVRDVIMKAPAVDMMNSLARSVLMLYSYDRNADDISIPNVLRQCLQLIARFPQLAVYGYHAHNYDFGNSNSFFIHEPDPKLSTAENLLYMLRLDGKFTPLEAKVLDIALILHAEHGGGNNSTFTTHVVSSSGTDTYSAIAAALGSLKGPKHGGANLKVSAMFKDIKQNIKDWEDREEISNYLNKILNKEAFDKAGLIYGIGHAIYSVSDPRAKVFKSFVKSLSEEKGLTKEFELYSLIEELAPQVIAEKRKMYKGVSANVDFYSGFVYDMLGLPHELFTPIFAIARISGWSAHRIEELINAGKIIRPAYMNVQEHREYIEMGER